MSASDLKEDVREFWQRASCGEAYAHGDTLRTRLEEHSRRRYALEPYIEGFARFQDGTGLDVLEIGVGMGADHLRWAAASPRRLVGMDLTARALEFTGARLALDGRTPRLTLADAERLPFPDARFDLVYSWGVLHHTPDTPRAIGEVYRVLKPGGRARVMIYHRRSVVGSLLWIRYALLAGRWNRSLDEIYARHLESPGTKAYSAEDAAHLFASFRDVRTRPFMSFADLLQGAAGQRHDSLPLRLGRRLWPRWLLRRLTGVGLYLLIEARK